MTHHVGKQIETIPFWSDSASLPEFPKLNRSERVDVVIVGGGLMGLTSAYLLTTAGRRVAVLERDRCASIDTGHTTAHLTMVTDKRLKELIDDLGRDHAQAVWDAGLAAIAQIHAIVRHEQLACDFGRDSGTTSRRTATTRTT
jgi:glycine/D-amino acid oxidase-like deaminating enzyme